MINKAIILFTLLLMVATLNAQQQPPAQLPSLLEGTTEMPVLHDNENPDDFIRSHIFVKVSASKI